MKEVAEGLLIGPVNKEEIEKMVSSDWVGAPRFGLNQKNKIRPIDDFARHTQ